MIALLMLSAAAGASETPRLPAELRQFLARREGCNHWAGEEGYDAERRQQIARALKIGRCDTIAADEDALRHDYRDVPDMLAILDQADEMYGAPD